jgi:hypothetical protein
MRASFTPKNGKVDVTKVWPHRVYPANLIENRIDKTER